MKSNLFKFFLVLALTALCSSARAQDAAEAQLTLSNHVFSPQELTVPAGRKIKLTIINTDAAGAEFESEDLGREKVIPANGRIYVYIGPLDPGAYHYFDDFHRATATGKIIAQ